MTAGSVIVNGYHGILPALGQCPDGIVDAFLHFGIGPLHRIELNGVPVFPSCHGRNRSASHAYSVIVPAQEYDLVSFPRFSFQGILHTGKANASCQHDDLVVSQPLTVSHMFKTQKRSADQGLPELVAEIACSVRGFGQYIFRGVVHPFPSLFPVQTILQPGIRSHVNGRSGYRERSSSTGNAVPDLSPAPGSCPVKRFHGSGKIVGLCFQADHRIVRNGLKRSRPVGKFGNKKHMPSWSLDEGTVILIGRDNQVGISCRCVTDHVKQGVALFFPVQDECPVEYFMPAVL